MQITEKEIDSVEHVGELNKLPVKMIRTKGGFYIAIGREKGSPREEALAAGSHPAIVKYNLEKKYKGFEPVMMKSEGVDQSQVESHSHFLSEDLRKSGHDIYSVQDGLKVDFHITKHNNKIATLNGHISEGQLVLNNPKFDTSFNKAVSGAVSEKALSCKVGKVTVRVI